MNVRIDYSAEIDYSPHFTAEGIYRCIEQCSMNKSNIIDYIALFFQHVFVISDLYGLQNQKMF